MYHLTSTPPQLRCPLHFIHAPSTLCQVTTVTTILCKKPHLTQAPNDHMGCYHPPPDTHLSLHSGSDTPCQVAFPPPSSTLQCSCLLCSVLPNGFSLHCFGRMGGRKEWNQFYNKNGHRQFLIKIFNNNLQFLTFTILKKFYSCLGGWKLNIF